MQSSKFNHRSDKKSLIERREKVMLLLTKGLKGYQIAEKLNLTPSMVSRDISYLSKESNTNLDILVKNTLPFMYTTSIEGIKNVLEEAWKVYGNEGNDVSLTWSNRLKGLEIIKNCHESLFKLVVEGPSIVYLKELEKRLEKIENYKKETP
jgi:predicted transcriptional regulator